MPRSTLPRRGAGCVVALLVALTGCNGVDDHTSTSAPPRDEQSTSVSDPSRTVITGPAPTGPTSTSFPVSVAADGRSLVDSEGHPWLMVGDAGWSSLVMLSAVDQDHYFDELARHRFNTVLVNVIENHYSNHPPLDASGEAPFEGEMYRSAPNELYWAGFDRFVAAAAERGITLLAAPVYLGSTTDGELASVSDASVDQMAEFGSFLGRRYGAVPNVIWVVGGDRSDISDDIQERLTAFVGGLRESSSQFITGHTGPADTATDVFGHLGWVQLNTVYNVNGKPVESNLAASQQEPILPTFSMEGSYEQERKHAEPGAMLLRYQAYGAVLSGAFGHVFGNNPRWHFNSVGLFESAGTWQQSLDDDGGPLDLGTRHMAVFADVIGGIPWWKLRPDIDRLVVAGRGSGTHQVAASMDSSTGWAAVYTVADDQVELDLTTLSRATAQVDVRRVDPTSGAVTDLGATATIAAMELRYPGPNASGDVDWLYLLSPVSP